MTEEDLAAAAAAAVAQIGRQLGAEVVRRAQIPRGCSRPLPRCEWRAKSS